MTTMNSSNRSQTFNYSETKPEHHNETKIGLIKENSLHGDTNNMREQEKPSNFQKNYEKYETIFL